MTMGGTHPLCPHRGVWDTCACRRRTVVLWGAAGDCEGEYHQGKGKRRAGTYAGGALSASAIARGSEVRRASVASSLAEGWENKLLCL